MAKGYIIAHIDVKDAEEYKKYIEKAGSVFKKYGAVALVRGGKATQLEGEKLGTRHIVLEFPSYQVALDFYNSEEYKEARKLRHKIAITTGLVVEGV